MMKMYYNVVLLLYMSSVLCLSFVL